MRWPPSVRSLVRWPLSVRAPILPGLLGLLGLLEGCKNEIADLPPCLPLYATLTARTSDGARTIQALDIVSEQGVCAVQEGCLPAGVRRDAGPGAPCAEVSVSAVGARNICQLRFTAVDRRMVTVSVMTQVRPNGDYKCREGTQPFIAGSTEFVPSTLTIDFSNPGTPDAGP